MIILGLLLSGSQCRMVTGAQLWWQERRGSVYAWRVMVKKFDNQVIQQLLWYPLKSIWGDWIRVTIGLRIKWNIIQPHFVYLSFGHRSHCQICVHGKVLEREVYWKSQ